MDHGDKIYTLVEIRCWKVEILRHYSRIRGLTKTGTKEELAALFLKKVLVTGISDTFKCILVA